MSFASIPEVLAELAAGRFIVLVDDPRRENEGDLIGPAESITNEKLMFMHAQGRGEICVPISGAIADRLELDLQATRNTSQFGCAKTVTVDAVEGATTGISASDRVTAIRKLASPSAIGADFSQPGHVRPIRARDGGVLVRTGHTEGGVDLCRLAGLQEAAVICEILDESGEPRRLDSLREFATEHDLLITTIEELIRYRRENEKLVHRTVTTQIPTPHGRFDLHLYRNDVDDAQHLALTLGLDLPADGSPAAPLDDAVLVRVHSECLTGDVFGSSKCDCGGQLQRALARIGEVGRGCLLYLRQEGRGIGLEKKLHAYRLQEEQGLDTVEANLHLGMRADAREYGVGAQILTDLGIRSMTLLTNNPKKLQALSGFGLSVAGREPLELAATKENVAYLRAKRDKLGHLLSLGDA